MFVKDSALLTCLWVEWSPLSPPWNHVSGRVSRAHAAAAAGAHAAARSRARGARGLSLLAWFGSCPIVQHTCPWLGVLVSFT